MSAPTPDQVSVLLPVYERERWVRAAIESVLAEGVGEVVLVDDVYGIRITDILAP